MAKKKIVEDFGDDGVDLKKHRLKKDSFFTKLKNKVDEIFETDEDLSFFGKLLMLSIYGVVSSVGLIIFSSVGNVLLKLIWAATRFTATCPTFGGIGGIGWFMFIVSFLTIVAFGIAEYWLFLNSDFEDCYHSLFLEKKEDN